VLEVHGKPLIERNIQILRDKLNIKKIIVVIGRYGDQIVDFFNDKSDGIEIVFVEQAVQKGIGHALLTVENHVGQNPFVVILGDEVYIDSNHEELSMGKIYYIHHAEYNCKT